MDFDISISADIGSMKHIVLNQWNLPYWLLPSIGFTASRKTSGPAAVWTAPSGEDLGGTSSP